MGLDFSSVILFRFTRAGLLLAQEVNSSTSPSLFTDNLANLVFLVLSVVKLCRLLFADANLNKFVLLLTLIGKLGVDDCSNGDFN